MAGSAEAQQHWAAQADLVWQQNPNGALLETLYQTGLNREPEAGAIEGGTSELRNGVSALQLAQNMIASPEFTALHAGMSASQEVASCYADGLGRAPDPQGLQAWTGQLQSGSSTLANVLLGFASSAEAAAHLTPGVPT